MRCTLVLEFDSDAGEPPRRVEALRLHRDTDNPNEGDVGLTLAEAKTVLLTIQQEFVGEQLNQYCAARRTCLRCRVVRKLHDSHCSEVCTVIGRVSYVRERWKGCACGADGGRYISPLKNYLRETYTAELKWLHAKLGAMLPYRQALEVLSLLLPSSGRDSHVTIRNHTIAIGQAVWTSTPPDTCGLSAEAIAELGIDVGYVRKARPRSKPGDSSKETGAISILVAAVGPRGKRPRVWASAQPRTKKLQAEMTRFLASSGYDDQAKVQVISDAAKDLADLTDKLPHDSSWMLDWAHIGRKLWLLDQSLTPLAYGRLTPKGSAFELWDLFVRFRCYVWTGQTLKWQEAGQLLYELLELREDVDTQGLAMQARLARRRLLDALAYLEANINSLIDYRGYQKAGRRISTGYVESSINRLIGRRMCKDQHMRWSRDGADGVVQVRVALQNQELDALSQQHFGWSGSRRISWPWMQASHPF
jgi:hypothetical protein